MRGDYLHLKGAFWKLFIATPSFDNYPINHHHNERHNHRSSTTLGGETLVRSCKEQLHHCALTRFHYAFTCNTMPTHGNFYAITSKGLHSQVEAASWKKGGERRKGAEKSEGDHSYIHTENSQEKALKTVSSEPPKLSQKLAIFTIFHHSNHFEFFTKVVPKILIYLENQLSPSFHLICYTVHWRHQEAENFSFGILEARRSEDWGN